MRSPPVSSGGDTALLRSARATCCIDATAGSTGGGARRRPCALGEPSGPQVMAGVTARILAQIILVVRLRAVPGGGRLDGGGDRARPLARPIHARAHALGDLLLLGRLREDRRAI